MFSKIYDFMKIYDLQIAQQKCVLFFNQAKL